MGEKEITDQGFLPDDPERSDPVELVPPRPVLIMAALDLRAVAKVAFNIVDDVDAAEDISKRVYTSMLRLSQSKLESIECLQAYANVAARNTALNWLRARRGREASLEGLDEAYILQQDPTVQMNDLQDLTRELERLPEDQVRVFVLYWVNGYTAEEVAEVLGITPEAVTKRAARVRNRLKKALEESWAHKFPQSKEQK